MSNYIDYINETLRPRITEKEIVLDLFAGCGGLSLGFEAAGFKTIGYEMDKAASDTYNSNLSGECYPIKLNLDFEYPQADIIIGGPPCQMQEMDSLYLLMQLRNFNQRFSCLRMSEDFFILTNGTLI
jgi:predicted RNA methylase